MSLILVSDAWLSTPSSAPIVFSGTLDVSCDFDDSATSINVFSGTTVVSLPVGISPLVFAPFGNFPLGSDYLFTLSCSVPKVFLVGSSGLTPFLAQERSMLVGIISFLVRGGFHYPVA